MFIRRRRATLAGEMLILQLAIVVVVLLAVGAISLAQSAATFDRVEGRRVTALAEQLAWNPLLRAQIDRPAPREVLAPLLHSTLNQSGVTSVTVADVRGTIISSTNPTLLDTALPLGDAGVARARGWSGHLVLDGTPEVAAQVPVLDDAPGRNGHHLGTVSIGVAAPTVWQRLVGASSYLLTYLSVASLLGGLGSWLLARRVKRQTLGMEPREIAGLAEHREAMLHGIAEGVIALDQQRRLTMVNDMGRALLDLPEHCVGMSLPALGIHERLYDVLTGAGEARDEIAIHRGRVLVMNRMTIRADGRRLGSVTTLRDRTELAQLERELGSFRSSTELLRAQAHEFANQLHVISGLIQVKEHDEVVRYIRAIRKHRESLDLKLSSGIGDTSVAALLMAKSSLAAERRVELRLSERTALDRLDPLDAADVATVTGNLVDNAIDAASGAADGAWVEVELRQDTSSVEIVVRDSGPGVAPELAREVFTRGFTTKAAQGGERGIGLALTQLVCHRRGGEVTVTNTTDGAMFTARLSIGQQIHETMETPR
ncbi:sensor histidine kinase [Nonomuraea jabiensis]|uniref:histidine kinase n=1 Tax=Nonomuraea jabiensis TaxID=882448 RepID=A0A7W9LFL0_9ACTN|nr:ATP-binding protein [Nonomuraea jabiensis]MBB5781994.1 sensor histidine kinase regulating citrate/malate metabolism [Nonomuraea jabiensis]